MYEKLKSLLRKFLYVVEIFDEELVLLNLDWRKGKEATKGGKRESQLKLTLPD